MARNQPVVDREQQLEHMTGETELARHDEQLDRQTEHQERKAGPEHPGRRPDTVPVAPSHRRGHPAAPAATHVTPAERAEFGVADPPLPGGILHPPAEKVEHGKLHPKVPGPYYDGVMAHGVPIDVENPPNHGRITPTPQARHGHEASDIPRHEVIETEPDPVPVYIVQRAGGGKGKLATATDSRTAPVAGSDPVRLTSQDLRRTRVALLNESGDSGHDFRFSTSLADLAMGKGALVSHLSHSYLWLHTQDDLYAVSVDTTAVAVSVLQEYELPGGG